MREIRLAAIDAPEQDQPFGTRWTKHLSDLVFWKPVDVELTKHDRNGRIVGKVWVAPADACPEAELSCPMTLDVGLAQINAGMAWHYKQYAKEQSPKDRQRYSFEEEEAAVRRAGLWADKLAQAAVGMAQLKSGQAVTNPTIRPLKALRRQENVDLVRLQSTGGKLFAASSQRVNSLSSPMCAAIAGNASVGPRQRSSSTFANSRASDQNQLFGKYPSPFVPADFGWLRLKGPQNTSSASISKRK